MALAANAARSLAAQGICNLIPPTKAQRKTMPKWLQKVIAEWRNRIETTFGELTDIMELARHGAHLPRPARANCRHHRRALPAEGRATDRMNPQNAPKERR